MIDYKYKSYVMEIGITEIVKYLSQYEYAEYLKSINSPKLFSPKFTEQEYWLYRNELETYYPDEYKEAIKINHATYERSKRLCSRVSSFITHNNCLFLTLTFTDIVFDKTNFETRKKYVKNYLKSFCDSYVANVDYGSENGREHYHAIVVCDYLDIKKFIWSYGAINFERIISADNVDIKISKYISKLTNHAIKSTTKGNRVIYSR